MKKRTLSLVLVLLTLLSASCGAAADTPAGQTAQTAETAAEETTEATEAGIPEPELPALDYDGATFTYLSHSRDQAYYKEAYLFSEGIDGEVVNDAVFNRNIEVENKFNIKMVVKEQDGQTSNLAQEASKYVQSQDPEIDVLNAGSRNTAGYTAQGFFVDLYTLPYVSLESEYWSKMAVQGFTMKGKLFMTPCDISMAGLSGGRFFYFNKKLITDYDLTEPYALVENNQWTIDTLLGMIEKVSADLNGDGVMDYHDRFGMLTEDGSNYTHMLIGCGESLTKLNENGEREYAVNEERAQQLLEKLRATFEGSPYAISYTIIGKQSGTDADGSMWTYSRKLFAGGQFLFVQNGLNVINTFRDMEDDFGVAPNPKFDEAQEEFYHLFDPYAQVFSVPISCGDTERVGAVMEYTAWLSNKTVLPAYYEITILQKRSRDQRDVDMLEIVRKTIYYEFDWAYGSGISDVLGTAYTKGSYSSAYASAEKSIASKLEKLAEQFEALE